jgi:hypothetical protein
MSEDEVLALCRLFTQADAWFSEAGEAKIKLIDFYRFERCSEGGSMALAWIPGTDSITAVMWTREDEFEVRCEISQEGMAALSEMSQFLIQWHNAEGSRGLKL